jgi:hypothetical protein
LYHFACGYGRGLLADRWTMIGLPCEPGSANSVLDIFGDNLNPSLYHYNWVIYERDETTDVYNRLNLDSSMNLGQGYWILSVDATVWDLGGTATPRDTTNSNCPSTNGCYEISLTAPEAGQPPRYNLISHVFSFEVNWEDVRYEVDGTVYTPGLAETAGFIEKEMWVYSGNGYDVYDDTTPGMEGTLVSQEGLWVAVLNGAAGKTVKLLVPANKTYDVPPPPPPEL